jgi:hypothetical protein
VTIHELTLSADRKTVLVKIKGLVPVMQMRIGYQVTTKDGATLSGAVHNTIHRVGKATE